MIKKLLPALLAAPLAVLASCGGGQKEIQNDGSNTMLVVAGALAEIYHDKNPEIVVSVSGSGSGVGIASLVAGDVDIANASRPMKKEEIESAKKNGNDPVEHIVGYDGIAVYVHKDNPIESLSVAQLKGIFGKGGKVNSWKDLGVDLGSEDVNEIAVLSRQSSSGTYECFRNIVLGGKKESFKPDCRLLNGSKEVVEFCAKTKSAIGYSGLAYATDDVKIVPVQKADGSPAVGPTIDSVLDKSYAIARPLYMYTNGEPQGDIKAYVDWIKSDEGQKVLLDKGYVPMRKP
ncbi:MAG: phosphate ABC transporter substrate-binding protein [bacterium]|nr:phosphate ABC transporter substrate-binding protein [bacterium]